MSTWPKRARVAATSAWMSASVLTSQRIASARFLPSALMAAATPSACARFRSATTMPRAPSAAKRSASPAPMPLAPPVMMATLPWMSMVCSLVRGWVSGR